MSIQRYDLGVDDQGTPYIYKREGGPVVEYSDHLAEMRVYGIAKDNELNLELGKMVKTIDELRAQIAERDKQIAELEKQVEHPWRNTGYHDVDQFYLPDEDL